MCLFYLMMLHTIPVDTLNSSSRFLFIGEEENKSLCASVILKAHAAHLDIRPRIKMHHRAKGRLSSRLSFL